MRFLVITTALCLLCLTAPVAYAEYDEEECSGNSCNAPPEGDTFESTSESESTSEADAYARADADAEAKAVIKKSGNSESNSYVEDSGNSESSSYSRGGSAYQGQDQDQDQKTRVNTTVKINNPAADVKGAAKEAARRAAQAARVTAGSSDGITPCGDHTGLSISTGIAGGGLGTITEACRAFRVTQAESVVSPKKAFAVKVQYWIGFPFRLVLHVATLGVLN